MKKRILSLALALTFALAFIPAATAANSDYSDVPSAHWAYGVIAKWSGDGYGVLQGDGGSFFPDRGLSLGELAAILTRSFGYAEKADADVTPAWAAGYVQKAVAAGIIAKADKIDADVPVTREQAIKYIALAYNIAPVEGETSFADNALISAEYKPYVNAFQKLGYVVGNRPATPALSEFMPKKAYTRAEAMQVIENTTGDIIDADIEGVEYSKTVIIRSDGVTVTDAVFTGDLIIGQGVGDGDVILDNVTVEGTLIVYGGGSDSIIIRGDSAINAVILNKNHGDPVRLKAEGNATIGKAQVAEGSHAVISGTNILTLSVAADAEVTIEEGSVLTQIIIEGDRVTLIVETGSFIEEVVIFLDVADTNITGGGAETGIGETVTRPRGNQNDQGEDNNSQGGGQGNQNDQGNQGGGSQGGGNQGSQTPSVPNPVTTAAQLQDALNTLPFGSTITITANLDLFEVYIWNPGHTVVIPSGVTVKFDHSRIWIDLNGALTINGSLLLGTTGYVWIGNGGTMTVNGTLSGAAEPNNARNRSEISIANDGIVNGNANLGWLVPGTSATQINYDWSGGQWRAGVAFFSAESMAQLAQAVADIATVRAKHPQCRASIDLDEEYTINENTTIPKWTYVSVQGNITLASGVTMSMTDADKLATYNFWLTVDANKSFTVNGTLQLTETAIDVWGGTLNVNGTIEGLNRAWIQLRAGEEIVRDQDWNIINRIPHQPVMNVSNPPANKGLGGSKSYSPYHWRWSEGEDAWHPDDAVVEDFGQLKDAISDGVWNIAVPDGVEIDISSDDISAWPRELHVYGRIHGSYAPVEILDVGYAVTYRKNDQSNEYDPIWAFVKDGTSLKDAVAKEIPDVWVIGEVTVDDLTIPAGVTVYSGEHLTVTGSLTINGTLTGGVLLGQLFDIWWSVEGKYTHGSVTREYRGGGLWMPVAP
jgi:hypothetical protein